MAENACHPQSKGTPTSCCGAAGNRPASRWMHPVSRDVYRFQPLVVPMKDLTMVHGLNEHLTLENVARMTDFYARLIATAAG